MLKNEHAINILLKEKDTWEDLAAKGVELKSIEDWKRRYDAVMIHKNGYWQGLEAASQHKYDSLLGDSLANFFTSQNVTSLVDFGCGMGNYVKTFQQNLV